ncbi:hypothetical protein EAO75_35845 [Streptomyces sp. uw30]|uniref:hypothetical protein n=1 Tax=Streptomyces sp. uw30 TaxID=1828179 RepID=UPI0011CD7BD9|nr:hypothetical protein [Streptomyces sp. uw30]TXS40351.1 hypothetical protein EAO75_35845 [Streptomyces sp. uw30]
MNPSAPSRSARTWLRALTALLLALLISIGATPAGVADDKRPPGAADGRDLSAESDANPLLNPALRPVEELRLAVGHILNDFDSAFDANRNGAVDYLNPLLMTDEQITKLLNDPTSITNKSGELWFPAMVELEPLKAYLKPEVVEQLKKEGVTRLIAVTALNKPRGRHSEEQIQDKLTKHGIGREVRVLGASERQQCADRCTPLYDSDTPTVYGRSYDLSSQEVARQEEAIKRAGDRAAHKGPEARRKAEEYTRDLLKKLRTERNKSAVVQMGVDLGHVREESKTWTTHVLQPLFSSLQSECPPPDAQSQRLPVPAPRTMALAVPAKAADPCGEGEDTANTANPSGLGTTLTLPGMGNGGIDFSTMELRYLADPGDGSGLQYSFSADLDPLKGDLRQSTGITTATQSSDAFFVWLSLSPQDFWVNLNPNEPDRIVDDKLGRTDAGRVLLEADLRMKKTVGKLIHPHSALGRKFWEGVRGDCMSFRNWILPAPASVHQDGDKLYILDAPLDVQMETQYLAKNGASSARSCPEQDQATEDHNEALYRDLILPRLKKAINTAPEYAALRRVYLSRVAAEWYRELSRTKDTTYGDLIDSGDIDTWRTTDDWQPVDTFDRYVDSYTKGEFKVTDKTTEGNTTYVRSYVYGGVDLTRIPLKKVTDDRFTSDFAGLPQSVDRSLDAPSPAEGDGTVWLGSPTPRQAAASGAGTGAAEAKPVSMSTWALRLLPALVLALIVLLWLRRRRLNTARRASPLRRTAVGGRRR